MSTASGVAAFVALAWAATLAWLAIGAAVRRAQLQRRFQRRAPVDLRGRQVLLVRPCAGDEPGLRENLASVQTLATTCELDVVMSVDDPEDGAWPVIQAVVADLREAGIQARAEVFPPTGPNRKASMLAAALAKTTAVGAALGPEPEVLINVDSNVDLGGYPLDELLAALLDPEGHVGVAWAPWSERRMHAGLGPRASEAVLGGSLTAFPLLCGIYSYGLVGKIWAARREALDACELPSLTHYLGEDLEMARRLREADWEIVAAPIRGTARGGAPSFAEVVARFGRWMLAAHSQRPELTLSYPLFFFATPLVLALAGFGAFARPEIALTAAFLAVAARLLVTLTAQHWSGRPLGPWRALVDASLGDLALGLAWLRAISGREVEWRGHRLRVEAGGRLAPSPTASSLGAQAPQK